jgi:hypothetical protein
LEIVLFFDSAFDTELRQDGHHPSPGKSGKFRGFAPRSLSLSVSLDGKQDSAARNQVAHGFGQVAALFFRDLGEKLQNNLGSVDFSTVLLDVMTIADEVDSQLKQAMLGFMETRTAKAAS